MFKILRIILLLLVLASVLGTYLTHQAVAKDWTGEIIIKVIPVLADNNLNTRSFVTSLEPKDFEEVSQYLNQSAKRYGLDLSRVIRLELEAPISSVPPSLPEVSDGLLTQIIWALRLRWWSWNNQLNDHEDNHIRLFMLYQSPADGVQLGHSTGIRNGLIGLINARAFQASKRFHNVVLMHELLHIFGASDKYNLSTGEPFYPEGYVSPNANPRWPQTHAAIMGRAKAISQTEFQVAERLGHTRITELTAKEIGWPY